MSILVTGVNGQLGFDVCRELVRREYTVIGTDLVLPDLCGCELYVLDITDPGAVTALMERVQPDAVVHCAAWTAVDAAEEKEDAAYAVNAAGTENIARAAQAVQAKLVYISTDYVFDGSGTAPWDPDCRDYHPLNVYGRTKLLGEQAVSSLCTKHFIVRTSWVFGLHGNNFVKTMLRIGKDRDAVTVVDDQTGTPTYTSDLAVLLADLIVSDHYGYYHATNAECRTGEYISWADFTEEIFRQAGYTTAVHRVTTEEYGLNKAVRPLNSRLNKAKLVRSGFHPLPDWKDALARYLKELGYGTDHR